MTKLQEEELEIQAMTFLNSMDGVIQTVEEAKESWNQLTESYKQKLIVAYLFYKNKK